MQSHPPAAGEAVDGSVEFVRSKSQPQYQCLSTGLGIVGTHIVQVCVGVGHAFTITTGFGSCHLGFRFHEAGIAFDNKPGGAIFSFWHVLCNLGHAPLRRDDKISPIFVQCAIEQCKECGFAGTVAANQTNAFAGVDGATGVINQYPCATTQGDVLQSNHSVMLGLNGREKWRDIAMGS